MNKKTQRLRAQFEPETRFEVPATPALPFRAVLETELERLRRQLLREALAQDVASGVAVALRWAARDAAALAGATPYPLLVLPELFAEKARKAITQSAHQTQVRERSRQLMMEAA